MQDKTKEMFKDVDIEIVSKFLQEMLKKQPEIYANAINDNICPHCKQKKNIYLEHQNCSYEEKFRNYYLACKECHDEIWELYQDRWDDLYSAYK